MSPAPRAPGLGALALLAVLIAILLSGGCELPSGQEASQTASEQADTIGIAGGIAMLVVLGIAYFAGGYVAGRMSRFDGGRQGLGVWIWSVAIIVVLAIIGVIAGSEYNLFAGLNLPRLPIDEGDLTTGAIIVLAAVLIGTLLAAMAGGKAGERYHRKVDAVGHEAAVEEDEAYARDRRDVRRPAETRPIAR